VPPCPWQASQVTPAISGVCSMETKPPTKPYPVVWQGKQIDLLRHCLFMIV
jgi:hypothetical protein